MTSSSHAAAALMTPHHSPSYTLPLESPLAALLRFDERQLSITPSGPRIQLAFFWKLQNWSFPPQTLKLHAHDLICPEDAGHMSDFWLHLHGFHLNSLETMLGLWQLSHALNSSNLH